MQDLSPGHQHLKFGRFKEADEYFSKMAIFFRNDPKTVNGCLYGQARAMIGLRNLPSATTLLKCVIQNVPTWEAPYISLARVYELQGVNYLALGMVQEAKSMFIIAEQTFLAALNNTARSQRLTDHFEYFLREHAEQFAPPAKVSPSFTPGFTGTIRKSLPLVQPTTHAPQNSLDDVMLSKLSIKSA